MELPFEKTGISCLRQLIHEQKRQEQTEEIRLPGEFPDIGRVIGAWGQPVLRSKQWQADEITASGGVMGWVLYQPEDGSGPRCAEVWIPFQFHWELPASDREGTIHLGLKLFAMEARMASDRKISVRAGILGECRAYIREEAELMCPGETPDAVEILRRTYPVRVDTEAGEKAFELEEDLTLPPSAPAAAQIVRYELLLRLADRKIMAGKVVFRGSCLLHVLYMGENGALSGWDFELPFSQFGDLEQETGQEGEAWMDLLVTGMELELKNGTELHFRAALAAQYVMEQIVPVEIAEDAYGIGCEAETEQQELALPAVLDRHTEAVSAEHEAQLDCAGILDVSILEDSPRQSCGGDQALWEIPLCARVLCMQPGGELRETAVRWKETYRMAGSPGEKIRLHADTAGRPGTVSGSGSITLRLPLDIRTETAGEKGLPMITAIRLEKTGAPDPERPSLILCRAEEEPLWELARRFRSRVSAISQVNGLEGEPQPGQMLLIPVP